MSRSGDKNYWYVYAVGFLAVWAGQEAHSVIVGILSFAGLLACVLFCLRDRMTAKMTAGAVAGLALNLAAMLVSHIHAHYLWTIQWIVLGALLIIRAGVDIKRYYPEAHTIFTIVIGILTVLYGVGAPLVIFNPGNAEIVFRGFLLPFAETSGRVFGTLFAVATSPWGIAYIITLIAVNQLAVRKWGGLLGAGVMIAALYVLAVARGDSLMTARHVFSTDPASLIAGLLAGSMRRFGTPLVGLSLVALIIMSLTLASNKIIAHYYAVIKGNSITGNTPPKEVFSILRENGLSPGSYYLALLVLAAVSTGLFIAAWVALRKLFDGGIVPALPFAGLDNLSVPNGLPVWKIFYFILPVVTGIAQYVLYEIKKAWTRQQDQPFKWNLFTMILAQVVVSLFIPSGVLILILLVECVRLPFTPLVK